MSIFFLSSFIVPAMMMTGPFWFSRRYLELADGAKLVVALVGHPLAVALLPVHAEALALVVGLRLRPVTGWEYNRLCENQPIWAKLKCLNSWNVHIASSKNGPKWA